jgi:hypothetical protein
MSRHEVAVRGGVGQDQDGADDPGPPLALSTQKTRNNARFHVQHAQRLLEVGDLGLDLDD